MASPAPGARLGRRTLLRHYCSGYKWPSAPPGRGKARERGKRAAALAFSARVHAAFSLCPFSFPLSLPLSLSLSLSPSPLPFVERYLSPAAMQNDAGEVVDLYLPRKWCVASALSRGALSPLSLLFCRPSLGRPFPVPWSGGWGAAHVADADFPCAAAVGGGQAEEGPSSHLSFSSHMPHSSLFFLAVLYTPLFSGGNASARHCVPIAAMQRLLWLMMRMHCAPFALSFSLSLSSPYSLSFISIIFFPPFHTHTHTLYLSAISRSVASPSIKGTVSIFFPLRLGSSMLLLSSSLRGAFFLPLSLAPSPCPSSRHSVPSDATRTAAVLQAPPPDRPPLTSTPPSPVHSSATNNIIASSDHASVQIEIAKVRALGCAGDLFKKKETPSGFNPTPRPAPVSAHLALPPASPAPPPPGRPRDWRHQRRG